MNNKQLRWLILIVLAIVWGSSFILMKKALIDLTPIQAGALRIIFTAITLLIAGFNTIFSITKKEWYYIFLTAVLGTFFPAFLFAYAIQNIDSSIASILNSLTPLNTLIVGAMFYGFTFLRKQFIGIIIGLIGSVFLILKGAEVNPDQNYFYSIFIVLASIGYAFNVNILKKHLNNLNALTITTGNFVLLIIPALIILMAGLGLGMGIIISSLTTKYRDLTNLVGFGVQLFMYATPVIYPVSSLPEKYQVYILANPITPIIETFRFALLGSGDFNPLHLLYSFGFMIVTLAIGIVLFNKIEQSFMDTV